jgi:hypothetical protein
MHLQFLSYYHKFCKHRPVTGSPLIVTTFGITLKSGDISGSHGGEYEDEISGLLRPVVSQ